MAYTIDLRLPAQRDAAPQARAALVELRLGARQLEDLCLLVSELVSACVVGAEAGREVFLRVAVAGRVVRAEVAGEIALESRSPAFLAHARGRLLDRLTRRWGLIEGSGGAWIELDRDIALEHAERRQALGEGHVAIHERAARVHLKAAGLHRRLAAACVARGQPERAENEARRGQAAQRRCESELFRMRRAGG